MLHSLKVSVIMPVERLGGDAERAIASVFQQQAPFAFELIVVSAAPLVLAAPLAPTSSFHTPFGTLFQNVVEPDRNPATRRNRAVSEAKGEILAFLDDDATASSGWLATAVEYLEAHPEVLALGGPDPAPADSTAAELISETLLSTRHIGSGVAAHEGRRGVFPVRAPGDVALVNLFVRRSAFRGFDESVGYIGEDTALIEGLMPAVVHHDGVIVFHRRRAFPGPYLRQRWRYRVKTGRMIVRGAPAYAKNPRIWAFLAAGAAGLLTFPLAFPVYYLLTFVLGARTTRLPARYWPLLPLAFAAHHLTYWCAIVWGMVVEGVKPKGR